MRPEHKYTGIPKGMLIENGEGAKRKKSLADIVKYGLGFSREKAKDASSVSLQLAQQRVEVIDYLAYVILGRIIGLSKRCPEEKKDVSVSVMFAKKLGEYINQQVAASPKSEFKGVDFTQSAGSAIIEEGFNLINADALFSGLKDPEMDLVRKIGSQIVPDNPKPESKVVPFSLE